MVEHGSSPDKHIHIIKGRGLDSLVEELARLMWHGRKDVVLKTLAEVAPAVADAGVPPEIVENLVLFGFKCGIAEVMLATMEGDLQMREVELADEEEFLEEEEEQVDGEV